MLKNRNKFVEIEFPIPSEFCHYWHWDKVHGSSGYSMGDLPTVNVTAVIRTATEKILLTG